MNYYRRFPGDYARDTKHLSLEQHGAYNLLLDHLYSTESSIPTLRVALKICGAMSKRDQKAVRFVLEAFFDLREDGYRHKRVDEELNYAESKRNAAKRSAEARWQKDANALPSHSERNAIPDSRLQTPDIRENLKPISPTNGVGVVRELGSPEFLEFWNAYPKRVDRQEAVRAWIKGLCDDLLAEILDGLRRWKATDQWSDQDKIPYPSTWLLKRRWKETPPEKENLSDKARELESRLSKQG